MISAALAAPRPLSARAALDDGQQSIDRDELHERVAEEGDWLEARGERFALLADNGLGWAVADLALHLRRLASVPLPGFFSAGQIEHALDDAGIDSVLTDDPGRMRGLAGGWRFVGASGRSGLALFRRELAGGMRPRLPPGTAKITYTSGSTGQPKGVCLSAEQIEDVSRSLA